jgi:hypothetical protein
MSRQPRLTRAQKRLYDLPAGFIDIDMFRLCIPVFTTDKARIEYTSHFSDRVETLPDDHAYHGLAGYAVCRDMTWMFWLVIPVESNQNTWVHEASHIVDYVIDHLGLDPGIDGTETRAYMLGHIFSSIEDILLPLQLPAVITQAPANVRPI